MRFNQSKLGYMERAFFPPSLVLFKCGLWCANQLKNQFMICDTLRLGSVNAENQKYFHKICKGSWVHLLAIQICIPWTTFQMFACLPKDKIAFSKHCDGNLCQCSCNNEKEIKKCQRNNTKERWKRGKNMNLVKSAA